MEIGGFRNSELQINFESPEREGEREERVCVNIHWFRAFVFVETVAQPGFSQGEVGSGRDQI